MMAMLWEYAIEHSPVYSMLTLWNLVDKGAEPSTPDNPELNTIASFTGYIDL